MFNCRVCREKDNRISDLLAQVEMMKSLILPRGDSLPRAALEADEILTPINDSPSLSDEEFKQMDEVQSEATRVLSGNY